MLSSGPTPGQFGYPSLVIMRTFSGLKNDFNNSSVFVEKNNLAIGY